MGLGRRFAGAAFWNTMGNAAVQIFSFIVFVVLARLLTPLEFGLVAFASIFVDISRQLLASGIPDALVRHSEWDEAYASSALLLNIGVSIAIGLTLLAIGIPVFSALSHVNSVPILITLVFSLPIDASRAIVEAKLKRDFAFKSITLRNVIATVFSGLVAIFIAFEGGGVWALVVNKLLQNTISLIFTWGIAKWMPTRLPMRRHITYLMKFSSSLLGTQALAALNNEVAGLAIGALLGPTSLAIYRAGTRLTGLLSQVLISPLLAAALPALSQLKNDPAALRSAYLRITAMCSAIAVPIFIGAGSLAPDLVAVILGERWAASGMVMTAAALVVSASILDYFFVPMMTSVGQPKKAFQYYILAVLGNGILAFILSPFGLIVTAFGQTARSYLTLPFLFRTLRTHIGLHPMALVINVAPPLLSALGMAAAVYLLRTTILEDVGHLQSIVILSVLGALMYCLIMRVFFHSFYMRMIGELGDIAPGWTARLKVFKQ